MEYKDYYQILGVPREASSDEIKKAYRKLARKFHPDVSKEKNAEEKFKELGEAYDVLQDPKKREAYDRLGSQWKEGEQFRPPPDWESAFGGGFNFNQGGQQGADFSDFFSNLFGGGGGFRQSGRTGRRAHAAMRGEDIRAKLQISLEDAYQGATRELSLSSGPGQALKTLRVTIPKGILPGQQIRLAGQGSPGWEGGPAGDLYIEVEYAPNSLFKHDKANVTLNVPLTPWEAALGTTLSVPTLGGKVEVKIPPGSQSGKKLRLKGKGIPAKVPGDQYLVLEIMTPPAESETSKMFYQEMASKLPFNPREGWS